MPLKRLASARSRTGQLQMEVGFQVPALWSILPTVLFMGTLLTIRARQGVSSERRQIRDAAAEVYRKAKAAQLTGKVKEQDLDLARALFRRAAEAYEDDVTTKVPFTDIELRLITRPNSKEMSRLLEDIGYETTGWSERAQLQPLEIDENRQDVPIRFWITVAAGTFIGFAIPIIGLYVMDPLVLAASDAALKSDAQLAGVDPSQIQALDGLGRPAVDFQQDALPQSFTRAVDAEDFLRKAGGSDVKLPAPEAIDIEELRTRGLDASRGWISPP